MFTSDLLIQVLVYLQPPIIGLLLALALRPSLIDSVWFSRIFSIRQRFRSTRFFECAAYSRLTGWLRYGSQGLSFCAVFLLYDIDLVFFFAEMTTYSYWTAAQLTLFFVYLGFFLGGLAYDVWRYGFTWNN